MKRRKKYTILVVCLVLLAFAGFFGLVSFMKNTDAYKLAKSTILSHPQIIELYGEPLQLGTFPIGNISMNGGKGSADLQLKIHGSQQNGVVYIELQKEYGKWMVEELVTITDQQVRKNIIK